MPRCRAPTRESPRPPARLPVGVADTTPTDLTQLGQPNSPEGDGGQPGDVTGDPLDDFPDEKGEKEGS
ncbi:hypothetical protein NL676_037106 [Syzygium grande]|nr:hypothetical protein NL676_037106 [Syzygium grande]